MQHQDMADAITPTPGEKAVNDTLELGRLIASLCLTSGLKSQGAVECALDIARRLIEANACETRR